MTRSATETEADSRSATIRTSHDAPAVVAASVRPDNTSEIGTRVADGTVETTIKRETTGGLRTTVDDYVVNLAVADAVVQLANHCANTDETDTT